MISPFQPQCSLHMTVPADLHRRHDLEDHLVRCLTICEAEFGVQVWLKEVGLLDEGNERAVNLLLVLLALSRKLRLCFLCSEELVLCLLLRDLAGLLKYASFSLASTVTLEMS